MIIGYVFPVFVLLVVLVFFSHHVGNLFSDDEKNETDNEPARMAQ